MVSLRRQTACFPGANAVCSFAKRNPSNIKWGIQKILYFKELLF